MSSVVVVDDSTLIEVVGSCFHVETGSAVVDVVRRIVVLVHTTYVKDVDVIVDVDVVVNFELKQSSGRIVEQRLRLQKRVGEGQVIVSTSGLKPIILRHV